MLLIFFLSILGAGLCEFPDCFTEDQTWNHENTIHANIDTPYLCQSACQDASSCIGFTWFQDTHPDYPHLCLMFNQTTNQVPYSDSISGPRSCTCSSPGSCVIGGDNIINIVSSINTELECQYSCSKTDGCVKYTWNNGGVLDSTCFLFSSCSIFDVSCHECLTGPSSCIDQTTSTHRPYSSTTTHRPNTTTTTHRPTTTTHRNYTTTHITTHRPNTTTTTYKPNSTTTKPSEEFAVILGGYPSLNSAEVWSPYGVPEFTSIPDFPGSFWNGFSFWTKSQYLLVSNDSAIYSWKPEDASWTRHDDRPGSTDIPDACLLSDDETIIFPIDSSTVHIAYFSLSSGWTERKEYVTRNFGSCILPVPNTQEILYTGGSMIAGLTSRKKASVLNEEGHMVISLPDMNYGRSDHGCTYTSYQGTPGILVTGGGSKGGNPSSRIDSVEFLAYTNVDHSGDKWIVLEALPHSVYKGVLRTINGTPYLFGGIVGDSWYSANDHTDAILMFDDQEGKFRQVGHMKFPRVFHDVAVVKRS